MKWDDNEMMLSAGIPSGTSSGVDGSSAEGVPSATHRSKPIQCCIRFTLKPEREDFLLRCKFWSMSEGCGLNLRSVIDLHCETFIWHCLLFTSVQG